MSTRFFQIARHLYCEPWLIRPEMHAILRDIFTAHLSGGDPEAQRRELGNQLFNARRLPKISLTNAGPGDDDPNGQRPPYSMVGNIAVVPLVGVIGNRVGMLEKSSGVTDCMDFCTAMKLATEDTNVHGVVIEIDSPGGTVSGVSEAAAAVERCGTVKPVVSYTDSMMASAAYWIGCAAKAIYCGDMASVGSVGVYMSLLDSSEAYKKQGVSVDVIKSGKFKGIGIEGTSLTEEQRAYLQQHIDDIGTAFRKHVSGHRQKIKGEHLDGRDFIGTKAAQLGFADTISNLETAITDAGRMTRFLKK